MNKFVSIGRTTSIGANPWNRAKWHAIENQNRLSCEICNISRSTEAHHGIVKRDRRFKVVDNICNLVMVCHKCHMEGKAENVELAIELSVKHNGHDAP